VSPIGDPLEGVPWIVSPGGSTLESFPWRGSPCVGTEDGVAGNGILQVVP
jgi:hypothetical protein